MKTFVLSENGIKKMKQIKTVSTVLNVFAVKVANNVSIVKIV